MENKKKVNIGWIISAVFLLVLLISASFAYFGMFTVNLENKVAVNIHASTIGDTSFIATSANLNVIVPTSGMFKGNTGLAAENTATLTVNLTGAPDVITTCTYDVVYEYDLSSEIYGSTVAVTNGATKEITMQVDSPSGTNSYASETNFAYDSTWTPKTSTVGAKKTLVKNAVIVSQGTSVVQNINITGRYYNLNVEQTQLGNKSFTGKIYVENNNCTVGEIPEKASELILALNGGKDVILAKGTPTFANVATTNEGMYANDDDYTATTGMKSYYFRGAVNNNWIKFGKYSSNGPVRGYYSSTNTSDYKEYNSLEECNSASNYNYNCSYVWNENDDIYWRIIRINGDGSIRLLYTGPTDPKTISSVIGSNGVHTNEERSYIGIGVFNILNRQNYKAELVGYMYTEGLQHGNSTSSYIKNALENWYAVTTLKDNPLVSENQIFCNDRSASTTDVAYSTTNYTTLSSWNSREKDYYYGAYGRLVKSNSPILTCPTESDKFTSKKSSMGNKTLEYPVGLMTADEVAMAGRVFSKEVSNNYLTGYTAWSASPAYFTAAEMNAHHFFWGSIWGSLNYYFVNSSLGFRPVVSLSSEAKLSGDRTYNNPYVVN